MTDSILPSIKDLKICSISPKYFAKKFVRIGNSTVSSDVERIVSDIHINKKLIGIGSRQIGLTTSIAIHALWTALFVHDSKLLITSHSVQQSKHILRLIKEIYASLPGIFKRDVLVNNMTSFGLDNGSMIVIQSVGYHTGRGMTITHAYLDDFAFYRREDQINVLCNLAPCSQSVSILSAISQKPHLFKEIFEQQNEFKKCIYKGFYKANFMEMDAIRRTLPEEAWKREYCCEFIGD